MSGGRIKGTVKWFSSEKGYGFITPDQNSGHQDDVFVHQTEIKAQGFRTLGDGEVVEFDIVTDEKNRSKAANVTGENGADVKGAPRQQGGGYGGRGGGGGYGGGGGRYGGGGGGRYGGGGGGYNDGGYGGGQRGGGGGYGGGGYGGGGGGYDNNRGGGGGYGGGGYGGGGY